MRRAALIGLGLAALLAGMISLGGAGDGEDAPSYKIVFDNASGLVEGADFRVGGVTVGRIDGFDVSRRDARAVVRVSVADTSFGGLKQDAACKIGQQSLIGEYFIECEPGRQGQTLEDGRTIPVGQTESPIASDLVQNIMRRPFRERFAILLSELGAGFAARGEDVNETIRRSVPALTETNRVLKILGDNRTTLRRLAADSGVILKRLGERRKDVSRFVREAGDTAATTAERREALAETFRRFPGFLTEFTPTLRDLGTAARAQAPAFTDLAAAAPSLRNLLDTLGPFARASEPAVNSLGAASVVGRRAVAEAESAVDLLGTLGRRTPEPANNLDIVLDDLDDRDRAAEPDPDSPTGKGYTGLEAILQYPFDQSLAINIFDTRGYILKLNALANECDNYTTDEQAKENPERAARCTAALGPNQPGLTTPDPSEGAGGGATARRRTSSGGGGRDESAPSPFEGPAQPDRGSTDPAPAPSTTPQSIPSLPELLESLPDLLDPGATRPSRPAERPAGDLLDFLLGP